MTETQDDLAWRMWHLLTSYREVSILIGVDIELIRSFEKSINLEAPHQNIAIKKKLIDKHIVRGGNVYVCSNLLNRIKRPARQLEQIIYWACRNDDSLYKMCIYTDDFIWNKGSCELFNLSFMGKMILTCEGEDGLSRYYRAGNKNFKYEHFE